MKNNNTFFSSLTMFFVASAMIGPVIADEPTEEIPAQVLFTNVNVFNGTDNKLISGMNVLVEKNLIKTISSETILANSNSTTIDGGGRTLMPGMIDSHSHLQMNGHSLSDIENQRTWEELAARSTVMAKDYLMDGFTTVRDAGGMGSGLRKTIDAGLTPGPRIFSSGAFIGPTGSHADFRNLTTPNETIYGVQTSGGRLGMTAAADGVDAIKTAARQNFMLGNTQIKIMSSGGVASQFDPWQLDAYSPDEIAAAVEIANNYGSYVMAHAYSKKSIMRNLEAGVKTIEHGFMFDGEIAVLMKSKGAYMTTNMTSQSPLLANIDALQDPVTSYKLKSAQAAFGDFVKNVNTHQPKMGFQVDCVGGPAACMKQRAYEKFIHADLFGNYRALLALTSVGGEIVGLTGNIISPYKEGKLGVIEEGAYADILLVDGNPLEDISVIGAVDKWHDAPPRTGVSTISLIMKDGKIYKNTVKKYTIQIVPSEDVTVTP